eukprot:2903715-Rhodomonas_salina.1
MASGTIRGRFVTLILFLAVLGEVMAEETGRTTASGELPSADRGEAQDGNICSGGGDNVEARSFVWQSGGLIRPTRVMEAGQMSSTDSGARAPRQNLDFATASVSGNTDGQNEPLSARVGSREAQQNVSGSVSQGAKAHINFKRKRAKMPAPAQIPKKRRTAEQQLESAAAAAVRAAQKRMMA